MLPPQLGTGTEVVTLNFQGLSGSSHRGALHHWLEGVVAQACPDAPAPPWGEVWGATLSWLVRVDDVLRVQDRRLLVAVDEVERLQDEIAQGRANTDFLDLVRAMGDRLGRVRVLLVSAHPLARLGRHWVDRLISVVQREISYLGPEEARALVCHPVEGFPDIYPAGGVDRILAETRCHPYLIQLVCDELCRRLNEEERLRASDGDLEVAVDQAIAKTNLFQELWAQQDEAERDWLCRLARAPIAVERPDPALRELVRRGFAEQREGVMHVAVPMFATWIANEQLG
jgi:hypothetical protein